MTSFEKEILKKLSQKASGVQSEETVLMKSFKYFDLNNNGLIELDEFGKAVEKIGIMIPTKRVSHLVSCFDIILTLDCIGSGGTFQPLRHW